jgi:peroxiredoxin
MAAGCASQGPEVGDAAPDFQLTSLDGQAVSLSDLKGNPVLLNFWATWCVPCKMETPYLQEIYDEWQVMGLVLLAVDISESSSKVEAFMQSEGFSLPVLLDSAGKVAKKYGIWVIPTTFFIDLNGVIQEIKLGAFQSKAEIEASLNQLFLGQGAP